MPLPTLPLFPRSLLRQKHQRRPCTTALPSWKRTRGVKSRRSLTVFFFSNPNEKQTRAAVVVAAARRVRAPALRRFLLRLSPFSSLSVEPPALGQRHAHSKRGAQRAHERRAVPTGEWRVGGQTEERRRRRRRLGDDDALFPTTTTLSSRRRRRSLPDDDDALFPPPPPPRALTPAAAIVACAAPSV